MARTQLDSSETAYVTYVTQSGEELRQLARKTADEQKQLSIAVATLTKDYLNAAAGRVVTALTTFVTTHPSDWANAALSTSQANAAQVATTTAATLTDATNQANAKHGEALQRADERKQKAIDRATSDKDAAIRHANQVIFEAIGEAAKDTALALLGLYDIVDLPWEPRPGADLPEAPFTLPDDIIDYFPRFIDTWFATVGTPETLMVVSQHGPAGGSSGGLPHSLIGSGAMFIRSTDDGGSGGIGPNGTNRTAARTSAWRKSGDVVSSGIFSFASDRAFQDASERSASGTSNESAPVPQNGEEHAIGAIAEDVTDIDSHGSGTSPDPDKVMAQSEASRGEYQIGGVTFVEADPAELAGKPLVPVPLPPAPTRVTAVDGLDLTYMSHVRIDYWNNSAVSGEAFAPPNLATGSPELFFDVFGATEEQAMQIADALRRIETAFEELQIASRPSPVRDGLYNAATGGLFGIIQRMSPAAESEAVERAKAALQAEIDAYVAAGFANIRVAISGGFIETGGASCAPTNDLTTLITTLVEISRFSRNVGVTSDPFVEDAVVALTTGFTGTLAKYGIRGLVTQAARNGAEFLGERALDAVDPTGLAGLIPVTGFARRQGFDPAPELVDFAERYADELDDAVANRMRRLGIPEESIGLRGTPFPRAFEDSSAVGGSNLHPRWAGVGAPSIRVDVAALDGRLNRSSPTWAIASWKDRIDAVIAHEWTEVMSELGDIRARHNHALEFASDTALPITQRARQILTEDRLFRERVKAH